MLYYTTFDGLFPIQHIARFEIATSFDGVSTCSFIVEAYAGGGQVVP
jgi:hypothetical protein